MNTNHKLVPTSDYQAIIHDVTASHCVNEGAFDFDNDYFDLDETPEESTTITFPSRPAFKTSEKTLMNKGSLSESAKASIRQQFDDLEYKQFSQSLNAASSINGATKEHCKQSYAHGCR